jgi:hypothetical protein
VFKEENYFFRVWYKKLDSVCKLSNGVRPDMKFAVDLDNNIVFFLYPEFETLSEESIVGDEWEALDEGTAIIHKPILEDRDGYYDMIRERVKVGEKAYFMAGIEKVAELEIIEIINEI